MAVNGARGRRRRLDGAVPVGLALIAVGVLLALDASGAVAAADVLAGWWPVAVVIAGLWWGVRGPPLVGAAVAVIGGLALAMTLDVVDASPGQLVLPAGLLVLGTALLEAGARVRAARTAPAPGPARLESIGGDARTEHGEWPDGAQPTATAVFGDATLVVAEPADDGDHLVVTVTAVFGDVGVEVPAGWRVEDHVTRLLGDVTMAVEQSTHPDAPVVALHGLVVFGDVRVRRTDVRSGVR